MKPKNNILHHLQFSKFIALSFGVSVGGLSTHSSQGATQTWSGTNSGVWDTSALNWDAGASAWTPTNDALFTGTPTNNVTTATGLTIGAITLDNTFTGSVTMSGSNTVSGATAISGGTLNLNNATGLGASAVTVNSGGTVAINTGAAAATVANDFSGAGILNTTLPTGANSLTLSGALNGFTGTLNVGIGSGGGKLVFSNATQGNVMSSSATINVAANGTLFVFNPLNYGSSLFLNGGTTGEALGQLRLESGVTWSGNITLNANTTIGGNVGTGASTIRGIISGSGFGFTRLGTGTTILTNANTYTGTTTISAGTLQLGNGTTDGSIANASNVTNNATLNFNNINALTYTGNITGGSTGVLTKTGAGTLTLGGTNTVKTLNINANTTIDIGTGSLTLSNLGASTIQSTTGGTINGTGGGTIVLGSDLGDIGTANGTTLTINAAITGTSGNTFEVYGGATGGTVVLANNANTFAGNVVIDGGTLSVANIGNTGSVTSNLGAGTTIFIGGSTAVLKYTGTGETTNRIISMNGTTAGAAIDQSGASGNLLFTNFATPGAGSKTLFLLGSTAGTGEISGDIINNSVTNKTGVTKLGTGTWTISGTGNTYSNGTRANAGTLIISGTVVNSASFVSVNNVGAQNATLKVVSGASLGASDLNMGEAANSRAAVFQSGGAITVNNNSGAAFRLGNNTGSYGYYNMSAGTLDLVGAAGEFNVGGGAGGGQSAVGVMDVSGGTITTKSWILVGRGDAGTNVSTSSGLLNITGGSISHTSNQIALAWAEASGATSILNVGGGGGAAALTGYNSSGTGVVGINLAATSITGQLGAVNLLTNGTLTVSMVQAGGANTETLLNFNGGMLKATATNAGASFLTAANLDAVHVYSGGGTIDNNGTAITIGRALQTNSGTGITTIAVTDGGAGYIGAPLVEISGGTGSTATAYANMVDDGTGNGTFKIGSITVTSAGVYSVAPTTVTLTGGGATTAATIGAITTAANVTTGGMTFTGSGTTTLTGTNTYPGDTTVNAGSLAVNGSSIADANKLVIDGTGKVGVTGTEVVGTLFFGGVQQADGLWGSTSSSAPPAHQDDSRFSGSGVVSVTTGPPVGGYTSWANDNGATGQTKDLDHDNDGVDNGIEYFMGQTGSTFTANPAAVGDSVTWPMSATYIGVYGTDYEVQYSTNLLTWTLAPIGSGDNTVTVNPGPAPARSVVYNMPSGGKSFVRLVVKN